MSLWEALVAVLMVPAYFVPAHLYLRHHTPKGK